MTNSIGYKLLESTSLEISFIEVKPNVRISHNGVILPSSNDLIVPFKAVNLNAVDVNIIKIYENNIHQFFQNNTHTGSRELSRVGRSVLNKKIDLTSDKAIDYGVWNNFSLDMSELIKPDPGAIYRIDLSFKKEYSLYTCEEEEESEYNYDVPENTYSYYGDGWGYYDYYYYNDYNYYDYHWRDRDDPCKSSYYYGKHASTNILASNIGLLAKSGFEKKILIAVTDIRTAKPWKGVDIELFDYQHQKVGEAVSNSEGLVWVDLRKKPQLLVASKGDEKGYLTLEDGQSLSMAHFNVKGSQVQNGLKGFIYGERGVWRPGDTLFLNFIIEDKQKILPEDHPVKFELYNSQTQLVKTIVKKNGLNGIFNFTVKTADDAPTGTWTAKVKVGGALFTKYLKVEAIRPNRLKIKLDYGVEKLSASKPEQTGKMEVKWLHGATAKNLKAKVEVTLSGGTTKFEGYEDYHFTDHTRRYSPNEELIFDGKIDETGHASIPSSVKVRDAAPGMLKAYFKVRVFEESGDFSIDRFSIPYSPYHTYVGVKLPQGDRNRTLLTDSTYEAQIVTVDENGKPVDVDNLDVTVYKVNWRWWWDSSDDYAANYTGSSYSNQVQRFVVSTKNGKGNVKFKIEYPDWGRYMIRISDREGKHSTAKAFYMDWPGWYKRGNRTNPGGASVLSFSTDKDNYNVGETVQVTIPAATKGRALVTVESGSKILKAEWLDVQTEEFNHEIEVTDEMAPNVYINITLVQPHEHDNSLPIRLYGVQPIDVTDPNTILKPVIDMPESIRPETTIKVKVSEENNKKMTYTLAIVDEGLLDLTRFKTPNPHPVFYAHEALGVKTWDLYNFVIGAYGGKLERILSIGGDEGAKGKDKDKINRFKPMVKFLGPFELASGKSNTHDIAIPNYIGSVRTMVIAAQDGAYGKSEETTPVKKPLMVLATLPRVLGPDETVKLPVTIFAMEDHIKDVKIEIIANNLFNSGFESTKTVQFDKPDDMVINFELQVAKKIGKGEVQVIVTSGKEKATYEIELEVRNPNPSRTKYIDAIVEAGNSWESDYELIGIDGTNKVTIEFSNLPPLDFDRRLRYLIGYPHGCIEQVTSQAFPQLYLKDVLDADERVFKRASDNVKIALEKLKRFQYSDGGMSYWPSGYRSSDWGTSYAGHFMLEAEAKGFALPPGLKSNWVSYQKRTARSYNSRQYKDPRARYARYSYDMAQAYRLFTLALSGNPEIGAMNRLKEDNNLSLTGFWRLAAAYHLAGQPEVAQRIITSKKAFIHEQSGRYGYTYGSRGRNHAMILEAMSIMEMRSEAVSLMLHISESLSSARWMSTQTTAYSLLAMVKFAGPNLTSKQMTFEYEINSDQKESINTQLPIKQIKVTSLDIKNGHISVTNNSEGILYTRVLISGKPLHGDEQASSNNLGINIKYVNMKGKGIDITKLEQGTDFIAEVTVTNPNTTQWIQDIALTQIFPSGWEIHNTRMDQGPNIHEED
ncbi:MAG: hypothetical protein JKY33_10210, partial [Bacteroidia bacterium]|nr:hypothetical protein [Bacteroidia bacterium]